MVVGRRTGVLIDEGNFLLSWAASLSCADNVSEGFELAVARQAGLVLITAMVCEDEVIELVARLKAVFPDIVIIVFSEQNDSSQVARYLRAGVQECAHVGMSADGLRRVLDMAVARIGSSGELEGLLCEACPPAIAMVGKSPAMTRVVEVLKMVADSGCNPVLVLGETGTGKEVAARAIHWWRRETMDDFVAVNCAALTANLLESELFGHVKGAFTGADREKTGLFEVAGKGTIFLDEISEMPLALQAKLLRVLQEKTFRKVGGTKDLKCEATVIASSNRELLQESINGTFRKDLYYRLAVLPVKLPTLASEGRRSDIPLLAEYFLKTSQIQCRDNIEGFSPEALEALYAHPWPGNVRELRNVIDRAIIMTGHGIINARNLMLENVLPSRELPEVSQAKSSIEQCAYVKIPKDDFSLETAEREFIIRALGETGGQRTKAAALLGITRATLHSKLKRYSLSDQGLDALGECVPVAGRAVAV